MHLLFTVFPRYLRQGNANIQDKVSSLRVLFKKDVICCEENSDQEPCDGVCKDA